MMRKYLGIILVLLLFGGGITYYYLWYKPNQLTPWSFVPDNSLIVYQPDNFYSFWKESKKLKIWKNIGALDGVSRIDTAFSVLDSLAGDTTLLQHFFRENELLISLHKTESERLSGLFLLKVAELEQHNFLNNIVGFLQDKGFESSPRNYLGFTINEFQKGKQQFAYVFYRNFVIASFIPFLVEDALRTMKHEEQAYTDEAIAFSKLQNEYGKIYLQSKNLDNLAGVFAIPVEASSLTMEWLANQTYFDLYLEDDKINLSGFSTLDTTDVNYLSSLIGVRGLGFDMKNIIPQRSALVMHVSFQDVKLWHQGLKNYWRRHNPPQLTAIGEIENKYGFDIKQFYEFTDDEIGYLLFEAVNSANSEKVFAIKINSLEKASEFFSKLSVAAREESSAYSESYNNRSFGHVNIDELPSRVFGPLFSGFQSTFYTIESNYLLIGSSEYALKLMIDGIDSENTWRQSVKTNAFLENTNDDANLGLYIKTSGIWNLLDEKLNPGWSQYIADNRSVLNQIEYVAVQFTNVDEKFYTNVTISHPGELIERKAGVSFTTKDVLAFDSKLISKPFPVRNHNDQSLEMIVQDSLFDLQLIAKNNKVVLTIPLEGKLSSPVYQLDYYKNNKLQFLFSVGNQVHLIDRTGTYIPGYPISIDKNQPIQFLSLIDYAGKKDYRIMSATSRGHYYLTDKAGRRLDGWKPMKLKGKPVMPGMHFRVRNKDYMLFASENGQVNLLDRRGKARPGFPLDLKSGISDELFLEKGSSPSNTILTSLTNSGDLIQFNLFGEVRERKQLYRETASDRFRWVKSNGLRNYLIIRESVRSLTVLDGAGADLFSIPKPADQYELQYYTFNAETEVLIVIDKENQFTYFYDLDGTLLHGRPLDSDQKVAMLYSELRKQFEVYCVENNLFKVVTLNR